MENQRGKIWDLRLFDLTRTPLTYLASVKTSHQRLTILYKEYANNFNKTKDDLLQFLKQEECMILHALSLELEKVYVLTY